MNSLTTRGARTIAAIITILSLAALSGCGSSTDPALVKSAGEHGNVLQANTVLLKDNALAKMDTDYLDKMSGTSDPKSMPEADLKKLEAANQKNLDNIAKFRRQLTAANVKLRRTAMPDFEKYLGTGSDVKQFTGDYAKTTQVIRRSGTLMIAASVVASKTFDELGNFLNEWKKYIAGGDAASFKSAGEASQAAIQNMGKQISAIDKQTSIADNLDKLVGSMAKAASNDSSISDLISELRDQYPDSFLPKHIVEK